MDKILTVQEPFASTLVHGLKRFEFRPWRIQPGVRVWIHAGLKAGVPFEGLAQWLRANGDDVAADYIEWTVGVDDTPRPDLSGSPLARAIYASKGMDGAWEFPFGKIVGWCVFGTAVPTVGEESRFGKFANPVEQFHALAPTEWKMHKGALGLRPFGGIS